MVTGFAYSPQDDAEKIGQEGRSGIDDFKKRYIKN